MTSQFFPWTFPLTLSNRCFVDQELEMTMIQNKNFPQKSLLARIFNEKTFLGKHMTVERQLLNSSRCLVKRAMSTRMIDLLTSENVYYVGSESLMTFVLSLLPMLRKNHNLWVPDESLYEISLGIYFSRRHSYNARRYHSM